MQDGKKVRRAGWNGNGMFIVLMPSLHLPPYSTQGTDRKVNDRTAKWIGEDEPLDCQPYIAIFTAQKQWQPGWLCSQADLLATDWNWHDDFTSAASPASGRQDVTECRRKAPASHARDRGALR